MNVCAVDNVCVYVYCMYTCHICNMDRGIA